MSSDPGRLQTLFEKYLHNTCTPQELQEFWQLISGPSRKDSLNGQSEAAWHSAESAPAFPAADKERIFRHIIRSAEVKDGPGRRGSRIRRIGKIAAAAAFAGLLVAGYALFTLHEKQSPVASVQQQDLQRPIVPGGNKAVLTLADGSTIALDSAAPGTLARQGQVRIKKISNGRLAYASGPYRNKLHQPVRYNTLATPRGGQYSLVLSDGTKVWLNAASSIRFPAAFTGRERKVEITGEAYFEVAKNAGKPFKVVTNAMTVEVLGTHFNVMAYPDEAAIKTTLLEGSVKVSRGKKGLLLAPGQQVQLSGDQMSLVKDPNVPEAVAWKDGFFEFDDSGVADIMRQIARWYDVKIVYAGAVPAGHITGKIPRSTNLSNILKMMELSGVHFTVKGREVEVL